MLNLSLFAIFLLVPLLSVLEQKQNLFQEMFCENAVSFRRHTVGYVEKNITDNLIAVSWSKNLVSCALIMTEKCKSGVWHFT